MGSVRFQSGDAWVRWLCKDHPTPNLDFRAYLGSITEETFQAGLAGQDPLDAEYEFLHQTGLFTCTEHHLEFVHRHLLVVMHQHRWELRMESAERLVAANGVAYRFMGSGQQSRRAISRRRF